MGWTYMRRTPGMTDKEFFEREFNTKLLATATKRSVFYAVYETDAAKETRLKADANGKVRLGIVVLINRVPRPRDGYNFGYKEMEEFMGPVESEMPARMLDMLSPLTGDLVDSVKYASDWRVRCRANAAKSAAKLKLRDGMKVKLPRAVPFVNGAKLDTFTVCMRTGRRGRKVARFYNGGSIYNLNRNLRAELMEAS